MRSDGSYGFFEGLRVWRELGRVAKLNRRPVISVDVARERYEPLMETLAGQLGAEFGVEWGPIEAQPGTRRRRVFETTRWAVDRPLSGFSEWEARLDATVRRVVDVVDLVKPDVFEGAPPEMPPEAAARMAAVGAKGDPLGDPDGEVEEVAGFFMCWRVRDRLGGDVQVSLDEDRTVLSAVASVKPA